MKILKKLCLTSKIPVGSYIFSPKKAQGADQRGGLAQRNNKKIGILINFDIFSILFVVTPITQWAKNRKEQIYIWRSSCTPQKAENEHFYWIFVPIGVLLP